jgi:hypothetical protein
VIVARTVGRVRTLDRIGRWVIGGAAWLTIAACGSLAMAWLGDPELVPLLWPAALWGFAVSWIFGIGRRILPARRLSPRSCCLQ